MNATGCAVLYDCEMIAGLHAACYNVGLHAPDCVKCVVTMVTDCVVGAINVLLHSDACNTGVDICTYGFAVRADIGRYCTGPCAVIHTY